MPVLGQLGTDAGGFAPVMVIALPNSNKKQMAFMVVSPLI
jgi:hypothetical protein